MANSEYVSRSQFLLQYLLAVDALGGNREALEHCPDVSDLSGIGLLHAAGPGHTFPTGKPGI